jgi:branched-chain amino acid aminotransferase
MKVFLNGHLVDARQAAVSVFDHSFLYGDGLYESVHAYGFRLFEWDAHERRLRSSARALGLRCPWSKTYLHKAAVQLLRANHQPDAIVRLTLSRGPGPLGLDPHLCPTPTLAIMTHPPRVVKEWLERGATVAIVRVRRLPPESVDPAIKSNNMLNLVMAKREAIALQADEALLLNLKGHLTEGTISNLFFVRHGILHTPSLECGLLPGITRRLLIMLARKAGIVVREGRYRSAALRLAEEIFLSGSGMEILPVVRILDASSGKRRARAWAVGKGIPGLMSTRLYELLKNRITCDTRSSSRAFL